MGVTLVIERAAPSTNQASLTPNKGRAGPGLPGHDFPFIPVESHREPIHAVASGTSSPLQVLAPSARETGEINFTDSAKSGISYRAHSIQARSAAVYRNHQLWCIENTAAGWCQDAASALSNPSTARAGEVYLALDASRPRGRGDDGAALALQVERPSAKARWASCTAPGTRSSAATWLWSCRRRVQSRPARRFRREARALA
jgi:hypothetical protein